ncbi:MAG: ribose-5-phosphate isomerase RpiA [Candidatus Rhabdochlamydia sp.]
MNIEIRKKAAADKAFTFIKPGMVVGLGTGSTAAYFIQAVIDGFHQGLPVQVVASSKSSFLLAQKGNLPLLNSDELISIDLYVDGADEIDLQKRMVKGGGGALLREKILAHMSSQMIAIVDDTKVVKKLGTRPLPVEIVPFGCRATLHHLENLGFKGVLRLGKDGRPWVTENQNYLYDLTLSNPVSFDQIHQTICSVPGVVETGFFPSQANLVIVGKEDGQTELYS